MSVNIRPDFFSPIRTKYHSSPPPRPMKMKRSNAMSPACQYNTYCCVARRINFPRARVGSDVDTEVDTEVDTDDESEEKQVPQKKKKRVHFSDKFDIFLIEPISKAH